MSRLGRIAVSSLGALALSACTAQREGVASAEAVSQPQAQGIDALFEAYDQRQLELSPLSKAYRGIRDEDYGDWGDFSDAGEIAQHELLQTTAAAMRANYSSATLPAEDALSYRLFDAMAKRSARAFPYRGYGYIFDQMNGAQSDLPAFLINIHSVADASQAEDYIERIHGLGPVLDTLTTESRERAGRGVMPPKWVYDYVISDIGNLLNARNDNAVLKDFVDKVGKLGIARAEKTALEARAQSSWNDSARPAYERLLAEMKRQQAVSGTLDGVWRFPEGRAYYDTLLSNYTTTDLTADQIHQIGLREVGRIHGEMREIMGQVGFEGTLQEFFEHARTDPKFYFDSREDYLAAVTAVQGKIEPVLPQYFATLPQAPLVVKPVEAFREQSAGKAFYQRPAPDGSRPGTYYVNLYRLEDMSRNELEALYYHEGLPGHHLQIAVQTELGDDIPAFRRFGGVTAYTEGWGLYAEELGKDMGFYADPYSNFGRLGMELWRAARLVVDTGIHSKRWSREQAIDYLKQNTPNPDGDIRKAIERYIVYPGQATAYMIGKLKIMELRENARRELAAGFDIREFHDVVLRSGPVPLSILEKNVNAWIAAEQSE
jgi:uncharacterized protein (DUF885 family)